MGKDELPEFADVKTTVKLLPFMRTGGIRHLLHSNNEFRKKCARKLGRKILIHIPSLLEYCRQSLPK